MTTLSAKIVYTFTDEAPALAIYSFLPVVEAVEASIEAANITIDRTSHQECSFA